METIVAAIFGGFMGVMFFLAVCDGLRRGECRIYDVAPVRFERGEREDVR